MNTSIEKLDLIHWITELQDISVLEQIKVLKANTYSPTVSEMVSIENGLYDFKKGNIRSHVQIKKRYEKWLGN